MIVGDNQGPQIRNASNGGGATAQFCVGNDEFLGMVQPFFFHRRENTLSSLRLAICSGMATREGTLEISNLVRRVSFQRTSGKSPFESSNRFEASLPLSLRSLFL